MVYASDFSRSISTAVDLVDTHDCATLTGLQLLIDRTSSKDGWGVDTLKRALDKLETGGGCCYGPTRVAQHSCYRPQFWVSVAEHIQAWRWAGAAAKKIQSTNHL
jgi:hypothetical protein